MQHCTSCNTQHVAENMCDRPISTLHLRRCSYGHSVTCGTGVGFGVRPFAANSCSVSFEGVKSCFSHTLAPYKRSGLSFFEFEFFNNNCRRSYSPHRSLSFTLSRAVYISVKIYKHTRLLFL